MLETPFESWLTLTGAGENDRGETRGDGGSGDQAKPGFTYGFPNACAAPGEAVRVIAVPAGVGEARGDIGADTWVQL